MLYSKKIVVRFKCEVCGEIFDEEDDAIKHSYSHIGIKDLDVAKEYMRLQNTARESTRVLSERRTQENMLAEKVAYDKLESFVKEHDIKDI